MIVLRMQPGMDPEEIEIESIENDAHWLLGSDNYETQSMNRYFAIISNNDDDKVKFLRPNCIINGDLYFGTVVVSGMEDGKPISLNQQEVELWVGNLRRASRRAIPLIREWDRGI